MVKKIGDKKVQKLSDTKSVKNTESVGSVQSVRSVGGLGSVGKVGAVGAKRRATSLMTLEERENYLRIVGEEAEKMRSAGIFSKTLIDVAVDAVKTAIDSALIEDEGGKNKKRK